MNDTTIIPVGKGHIEQSARLLAKTFRNNPGNRVILKGLSAEERERRQLSVFKGLVKACLVSGTAEAIMHNNTLAGVSLAYQPNAWPSSFLSWVYSAYGVIKTGPRFALRFAKFSRCLGKNHIDGPHWFFSLLGVAPSYQGKSLGKIMLLHLTERADLYHHSCYLETASEKNVTIYKKYGFDVINKEIIPDFNLPMWYMFRPPKPFRNQERGD